MPSEQQDYDAIKELVNNISELKVELEKYDKLLANAEKKNDEQEGEIEWLKELLNTVLEETRVEIKERMNEPLTVRNERVSERIEDILHYAWAKLRRRDSYRSI